MPGDSYFSVPIPKGKRIFVHDFKVAGASYRVDSLRDFVGRENIALMLKVDSDNPHDQNAIQVIAIKKRLLFGVSEKHVGYIPKRLAKLIVDLSLSDRMIPRAKSLWIGDRGGVSFVIDLLGDKTLYKELGPDIISDIKNWE